MFGLRNELKDTKEIILEKAMGLFLRDGYDAVSITDLQNELGIGRASLYYHFEDKKELLRQVFQKFFLEVMATLQNLDWEQMTLGDFILARRNMGESVYYRIKEVTTGDIDMFNFIVLIFDTFKNFPEVKNTMILHHEKELMQWRTAVRNSITKGEIGSALDVERIGALFSAIDDGLDMQMTLGGKFESHFIEVYDKQMFFLSLLKP